MKKLFIICIAVLSGMGLFGNEAAVLQANEDMHQAMMAFDLDKALTFLHPEYVEINSDGGVFSREQAVMITEMFNITQKIIAGKGKLSDFMMIISLASGKEVTAEMRRSFLAMDNSPEAAEQLAAIRSNMMGGVTILSNKLEEIQNRMREVWKTYKVISCTVSGNEARLVFEMQDFNSDKMEIHESDWVKIDGRWLCKKDAARYK